jgi:ribosomal protein L24E
MAAQVKRLLINNHENRMEKKTPKDVIWTESYTKIGKKKDKGRR